MIIECFALPEVGKSTLIKDLKTRYDIKTVPEQTVSYLNAFYFTFKNPVAISRFILIFLKESIYDKGGWKIFRFKLAVFINTITRLQIAKRNFSHNEIVMIDEGFIQRLLSLYETKQPVSKYISLLKKIPLADSVLFLEYNGESARIKNGRVGTIRRSISDSYTEEWRLTMLHNYQSLKEALFILKLVNTSYVRDDDNWFNLKLIIADLYDRKETYLKNKKYEQ